MLCLAAILLQLQADLTHPFRALARLDLVRLLALLGILCAHLLSEFLLAALALELDTLDNIDSATLWNLGGDASVDHVFLLVTPVRKSVECDRAIARERSSVRGLWSSRQA